MSALVVASITLGCRGRSARDGPHAATASASSPVPSVAASVTTTPAVASTPSRPVGLLFAEKHAGAAWLDGSAAVAWASNCQARRACPTARALGPCAPGLPRPVDVETLADAAPVAEGETLAVRGPLGLAIRMSTARGCRQDSGDVRCCQHVGLSAFVGSPPRAVKLAGLGCDGDESRLCCDVPAFGERVVAVGRLVPEHDPAAVASGVRWALAEPLLCVEAPARAKPEAERPLP